MSKILKYIVLGTAILALSLSVACKEDASPAAKEISSGAETGAKVGAEAGMDAASSGGAKEGVKTGGTEGGKAAASEIVN
jgi:hypothetical protein